MMNKYQKALSLVIEVVEMDNGCAGIFFKDNGEIFEAIDVLKELVEKATPKKPEMMRIKKYDGYNIGICKCGKTIDTSLDDDINFCPKCGQAIDWSDRE